MLTKTREVAEKTARTTPLTVKKEDLADFTADELEEILEAEKAYNKTLPLDVDPIVFFESLDEHDLHIYVEALRERLETETDVLERFDLLGLDPFVDDLLRLSLPFPIADATESDPGVKAFYRGGTIYLAGPLPTLPERLALLASRGLLGNDLFHEVFHGLQDGVDQYRSMEEVLCTLTEPDYDQPRVALAEAHAWLCSLPGFRHEVLADVIGASYGIRRRELLSVAFELLHALYVLGLSDAEVGRLVGRAEWCEQARTYPALRAERDRLARSAGLTLGELAERMECSMLCERIQGVRAVGIARELAQAIGLRSLIAAPAAGR